ncbi:cysteine ABC transporter ATP-binding protein [Gallibacterium salpingitidis]|uniref:Cysteine ABC transporter ATP-binding protein n=1 Tax=Gallibacterium salpingitidis TaxID=505341 RepID=A0AB36E321_9PAST|nr:cysteine/glutathione ABC transporter permease/ATP-binding protein CydD [Gallibacterium salpingitidis]OBX07811.1 cysteine ABC transporter ATP-binding protein [Gallibacterium salpingitidis]OBX09715.1 cysteine ABC transporter ATP-binding protein [Gallibacterium salpingitidis]WKT00863.1 cysteine/glutathione ABC transporter permease/ATP-binding protein CydD [Gallibacterium salpingitidis]
MEKARQKQLQTWLKQQSKLIKKPLKLNLLFAVTSTVLLVVQTWLLASLLNDLIIAQLPREQLIPQFIALPIIFIVRAALLYAREKVGFYSGKILRQHLRQQIIEKLQQVGPATLAYRPVGSWATLALEQVENLHNFYARYLPQQYLSGLAPLILLIAIFPVNWAAGLILLLTAPLIPLFMILVGLKAAEANQRNINTLARLSGQFLDRLQGLENLRIFNRTQQQTEQIAERSEDFRETTMDVLKSAFLSSSVLEFFTSISIALTAVYFGFSYLGQLNFGGYGTAVTLFAGFFCLILAPEFYQPLRDLGTYYHDKAAAIGAADTIEEFLTKDFLIAQQGQTELTATEINIQAEQLVVLSPSGKALTQPLTFQINAGQQIALVGQSGAGKTSLMNVLLGFLPYQGSLLINGVELKELNLTAWRHKLAWVGQNPFLLQGSIRDNLRLANASASEQQLQTALQQAYVSELAISLDKTLQDGGLGVSVGQAQRLAVARALLKTDSLLLLLDEPTASLDARSENQVLASLQQLSQNKTTLMITHRIEDLRQADGILVMQAGQLVQQGTFAGLANQGYFAELLAQRETAIN